METTVSLAPKPCSFYYPMASFPAPSQPLLIPLPHPAPTWARRCEALGGESRGEAFPFQDTRMDIWPLDSATILWPRSPPRPQARCYVHHCLPEADVLSAKG